jgi:predicted GH43/DUF377 family glycosyl hydrolase
VSADRGVADVVALAEQIPLLTVNLNNYKHPANPVLQGGGKGEWDEARIERPVVLRLGREDWRMWYSCAGKGRSIGLATSKDGVHWEKHPGNPVFEPAEDWEGGYMSPTSVLFVNGEFYLYRSFTLHVSSDGNGELRIMAWDPAAGHWVGLAPALVTAGETRSIAPLPAHAKLRLKFTPHDGKAVVSAWLVPR